MNPRHGLRMQTVCRVLAAALVVAFTAVPAALPTSASAASSATDASVPRAGTGSGVSVQLSAVSPQVARPGQAVRIRGTIRNTGAKPLARPVVVARLRTDGLGNRQQVSAWAQGSTELTPGPEVAHQDLGGTLAPGVTTPFVLTVPAAAVRNPSAFAALPLAVEVHGRGSATVSGSTHTFLPWFQRKEFTRLSLAFASPLTLDPEPPLFGAPSRARTAAWEQAIGPGSRIDRLLSGTANAPVTWAVDPSLLGPPPEPQVAGSPSTATPTPAPTPTGSSTTPSTPTADPVAALTNALGQRLHDGAARHPIWALPYSDPDLARTLTIAPGDPSVAAVMAMPDTLSSVVGSGVRRDVAWLVDGRVATARENGLRSLYRGSGLSAAVVSASSLPSDTTGVTPNAARRTPDGLPLLAYDDQLSRLLTATSSPTDGTETVQRFLAETITLLQERPSVPRSALVAAPRSFAGDPTVLASLLGAASSAPWIQPVSTTELVHQAVDTDDAPPPGSRPSGSDALAPGRSPLTRQVVTTLPALRSEIQGISSLVDPQKFPAPLWQDAATQLLSSRWRGQPASFATLRRSIDSAITGVSQGVRVNPSNVNFLADQGVLQITVVNTLDVPVHDVRLHLEPGSPRLRIDDQPQPLRINRQSRITVKVHVTAVAAGLVPVQASLSSANGTPIGQGARVDVRVSPTETWVYGVLGVVAGLVLVLGVVRSLRRGRARPSMPSQENVLP